MDTALFEFAAERLQHHTGLDRLEARGTLRLAVKGAGLDTSSVTASQLCVVFEKVMPDELEKHGVKDAEVVLRALISDLANAPALPDEAPTTDLDELFARLARD